MDFNVKGHGCGIVLLAGVELEELGIASRGGVG